MPESYGANGLTALVHIEALTALLAPSGLNLMGVVAPETWDVHAPPARKAGVLLPGAQAIVVIGNGGGSLWKAFVADLAEHPEHLCNEPHPLDAFVRRSVQRADAALGASPRRWFYAAATESVHLDFRVLGWLAGFGSRSRLGLLLHPRYGSWVGLRAACLLGASVPAHVSLAPDLCAGCMAPCVASCPGAAFPGGQWEVERCAAFKRASDTCLSSCAARDTCPAGAGHRYPELAVAYHSHRASGRRKLAEALGHPLKADLFPADGSDWDNWRGKIDVRGE